MAFDAKEIEAVLGRLEGRQHPVIACFFTSADRLPFIDAMERDPAPPNGVRFGPDFPLVYEAELAANPALHDGALLIGRGAPEAPYQIVGWSMRMYPPPVEAATEPNRGSAYNSCLAMSCVQTVDAVYLASRREIIRFVGGVATQVRPIT